MARRQRASKRAAAVGSGPEAARARIADRLHAYDWAGVLRHVSPYDVDERPLTESLSEVGADPAHPIGISWARRHSWAQKLLLPQVLRVAQCLEQLARAAGCDARKVPSLTVAMSIDAEPGPLDHVGPRTPDAQGWVEATWCELNQLADMMAHTLEALAMRDEQRRQLAALQGGANSTRPTRAVLTWLCSEHGQVSEDRLREVLRDVDLHMVPPPWDKLDRANLKDDMVLRISSRGRPRKTWRVRWAQVKRVARSVGLLAPPI